MDFLNLAPHLLADEAIIRMTLRHGAQLAHVHGFPQVHLHVPANLVGERHYVLSLACEIPVNPFVQIRRAFHAIVELALETGFLDLWRSVVTMHGGEILALLGENAMAVQIAVEAKITEDVEGVIDVLEGPARFIAAMPPLAEVLLQDFSPFIRIHAQRYLAQLLEWLPRMRIEETSNNLFLRVPIIVHQHDGLS